MERLKTSLDLISKQIDPRPVKTITFPAQFDPDIVIPLVMSEINLNHNGSDHFELSHPLKGWLPGSFDDVFFHVTDYFVSLYTLQNSYEFSRVFWDIQMNMYNGLPGRLSKFDWLMDISKIEEIHLGHGQAYYEKNSLSPDKWKTTQIPGVYLHRSHFMIRHKKI